MNIVLIGSGNTAHALGRMCRRSGHEILQVFGRNAAKVPVLASELEAMPVIGRWEMISPDADLYVVALPDQFLPELHQYFSPARGMVVHTAGSVPLSVLDKVSHDHGVLYPLQSLRAEVLHYSNIPLIVDGNTPENKTLLGDFAATLSGQVVYAGDEQRLHMHLAAVWVSNFTNYLYTIAWDICHQKGVDFRVLLPLMEHTVGRLHHFTPSEMQTGPAIRGDANTIGRHLELLHNDAKTRELYQLLSDAIAQYHRK
ncbi:MAG TPA: Rossmann-like and DUF2520 domain-containing protein [Phnomibacter sp.]|nr:Rossmann-like and DUF2520 domain-containing protein [Phnomibacter sp.]